LGIVIKLENSTKKYWNMCDMIPFMVINVFFLAKVPIAMTEKNPMWNVQNVYWEKWAKFVIFWREKNQKLPYLNNEFLEATKTKHDSKKYILFIWPLNDH
jgi:hypothetical protein